MPEIATALPDVLPAIPDYEAPFWSGLRERRLLLERCGRCSSLIFPFASVCPSCLAQEPLWEEASGRAVLTSWVVVHRSGHPHFSRRVPYNVAWVELAEGPRMISTIKDAAPERLAIGLPLIADYEPLSDEVSLLVFREAR